MELPTNEQTTETEKTPKRRDKRSAAEIRKETLAQGALLLDFKTDHNPKQKWANEWIAMQKYGLFVDSTGCIQPYQYYRKTFEAHDNLLGHIRAAHFFFNREPDRTERVNQWGWPCAEEVSHLCHNPDCCNPMHLAIESRWQNWKRHYCGIDGHCDCGMQPNCVKTYTNPRTFQVRFIPESDASKVKAILASLQARYPFVVHPSNHYATDDAHAMARQLRHKRERVHKAQSVAKQGKKHKKEKKQRKEVVE